ncbi:hypothetical protein EYC80_001310 [Monilinia laxa]|uniref:Uncharacterized protein n=1 Tax=Monilinia laxa TaxID=61186 RepID=A0A5N6K912_MONLA|nr:hypothetical protein EYC80_001310 [Monilinia laxa]
MEDIDRDPRVSAAYTTRLDQTLQDLQDRVKEQEALLEKLRATTSIPITDATSLKHTLRTTKTHYDTQTLHLAHAFNTFITTHLAAKLAAEELGGPIVGQLQSITPQTLTAGFTTQGKPKTSRSNSTPDPTTRQRRIDEIWGPAPASSPSETGDANEEPSAPKPPRNESQAAATELRTLTEQLLNALLEAATEGYESAGGYVTLARDSAAARFLVRSKVAQYHFRDARRLTLVDFGGDKRDNTKQVFEASKTSNASKVIGNEEEETKNITQKEKLNKVSLLINPQWLKYQHHPNIHSIR